MLEQLFNSRIKIKILRFFLSQPSDALSAKEIARKVRSPQRAVSRELNNLVRLDILKTVKKSSLPDNSKKKKGRGKYYQIDSTFLLYPEIRALFIKAQLLLENNLIKRIKKLGGVLLLILTGAFTGTKEDQQTDLLLVGKVNRNKLARLIKKFEKQINFEINFTVMSRAEYSYRKDITDRFLYGILEGKNIVVVDKINKTEISQIE